MPGKGGVTLITIVWCNIVTYPDYNDSEIDTYKTHSTKYAHSLRILCDVGIGLCHQ